jgi:uncharacterized protein YkvS
MSIPEPLVLPPCLMSLIWDKFGMIFPHQIFILIFFSWQGRDAVKFLEKVVVGDIASLKTGESKLSLIMNENGGIVDDTVITKCEDHM